MKNDNKKIREIIKYNANRNYFGTWTPKSLHAAYRYAHEYPLDYEASFMVAHMSQAYICDIIWNEMSYNPVRFGAISPFYFDEQPNIKMFCKTHQSDKESIWGEISRNLQSFTAFIENGIIQNGYIVIRCDENTGKTNSGYRALARLTRIIHDICIQNLADFNKSKSYREKIIQVVQKRHPNLARSTNNINFAQIDRVNYKRQQIQYAIVQKNAEINDISMRIKTLSEYDPPVDVHNEEELLEQKYQELQQLDEILASKTQIERE